jgi:hypothetical protein
MCMPHAVHYTIAGRLELSSRQKAECQDMRKRVVIISCYQPCQGHQSHRHTDHDLTRDDFNLPSTEDSFINFYPSTTNRLRVSKAVFFDWLTIVTGVDGFCLLLLNKPQSMRRKIMKWIQEHTSTVYPDFDPTRVIFVQCKINLISGLSFQWWESLGLALIQWSPSDPTRALTTQ